MILDRNTPQVTMEIVTDPEKLAQSRQRDERFRRNSDWLQAHIPEVYSRHRGRCICVAGGELFVADTPREVIALAKAAHPEDDGLLTRYIRRERPPSYPLPVMEVTGEDDG
jgi:hypothetical protein